MKRHLVVIPREDGSISIFPMKEWLRQHPDHVPSGLDPTHSTSQQLRKSLKKRGWQVHETGNEVRLFLPGTITDAVDSVLGDEVEQAEIKADETSEAAFALEYQLRDFIAQNIESISLSGQRQRLYVDPTGRDGVEYPTDVGPIDILAVDTTGTFTVFELKRARSPDHAIGQLTRYMGWVKSTIGKNQKVRGVIVAKEVSSNLRYAAMVIPDISLFEYEVKFTLKPAAGMPQG